MNAAANTIVRCCALYWFNFFYLNPPNIISNPYNAMNKVLRALYLRFIDTVIPQFAIFHLFGGERKAFKSCK